MMVFIRFSVTADDRSVREAATSGDVDEAISVAVAALMVAGVEAEATVPQVCHREALAAMRNNRTHADGQCADLGHPYHRLSQTIVHHGISAFEVLSPSLFVILKTLHYFGRKEE